MTTEQEAIFTKSKQIFSRVLNIAPSEIRLESNIMDDLGADSVELWDIAVGLENEFNIKFKQTDVDDITTVLDLVKFVESRTK